MQRGVRIIRRETGWYAQVLLDNGAPPPPRPIQTSVGIDVGLESFATLSTGTKIANPQFAQLAQRKLRSLQRRLSRCQKGSSNRRKAVRRLAREHERVAAQRRSFCHQEARKIVDRFDLIGLEKLHIGAMVRNRCLARSIMDAAWGMFAFCLTYKAANAGKSAVSVHAPGTSQECPWCGLIRPKKLCERTHQARRRHRQGRGFGSGDRVPRPSW
jgi:putative transposase